MALFLSHRGESDDSPENTLAAYQLAMDRDSDGIELDVRLTSDGSLICVHDADLLRVAGVPLKVSEHSLSELRKYHPVPLLKEMLAVLKPGKHLQIELKGDDPAIVPALKTVLSEAGADDSQLALSSFEESTISLAAETFPSLPRLILTDLAALFGTFPSAEQVAEYLNGLHCTGVSFKADHAATADFVSALHKMGFRVVCWGVFSDEIGLAMDSIGVDAMTCNHAVALRAKRRKLN